jgi:thioredoxin reductase (NADPH)
MQSASAPIIMTTLPVLHTRITKVTRQHSGTLQLRAFDSGVGSAYLKLGLLITRLSGQGLSWCATCDGLLLPDREIVVISGGDSAKEEALF